MHSSPVVLIVEPARGLADQIGAWLEEAGYRVLGCSGPSYALDCPLVRDQTCCLVALAADVVLIDLELEGDTTGETAPGWILADAYRNQGYTVLGLARPEGRGLLAESVGVPVLHKPVERNALLHAVRELVGPPRSEPGVVRIDGPATYSATPGG